MPNHLLDTCQRRSFCMIATVLGYREHANAFKGRHAVVPFQHCKSIEQGCAVPSVHVFIVTAARHSIRYIVMSGPSGETSSPGFTLATTTKTVRGNHPCHRSALKIRKVAANAQDLKGTTGIYMKDPTCIRVGAIVIRILGYRKWWKMIL